MMKLGITLLLLSLIFCQCIYFKNKVDLYSDKIEISNNQIFEFPVNFDVRGGVSFLEFDLLYDQDLEFLSYDSGDFELVEIDVLREQGSLFIELESLEVLKEGGEAVTLIFQPFTWDTLLDIKFDQVHAKRLDKSIKTGFEHGQVRIKQE